MSRKRSARSWNRDDSVLVLAAYFERGHRHRIPAEPGLRRVANLTRQSIEEVTRRAWMFAGLDPHNPAEGVAAGEREQRLWEHYGDDRMACMLEADRIIESKRRVPPALRRRQS